MTQPNTLQTQTRYRMWPAAQGPAKIGSLGQTGVGDTNCFLYHAGRAAKRIEDALGLNRPKGAVLQRDGYDADTQRAEKTGITHARCWAYLRRNICDPTDIERAPADQALETQAVSTRTKPCRDFYNGTVAHSYPFNRFNLELLRTLLLALDTTVGLIYGL